MKRPFLPNSLRPYYIDGSTTLLHGDTFKLLPGFPAESIDLIFSDPPYFLSNNGTTCIAGKTASVNKAPWDEGMSRTEKHLFNRRWIKRCKRVLSPNGTIWVSGTFHNIYSIGWALELEGFKILNNIIWQKSNPPPNLACRSFTHSTETVLWAKKNDGVHFFNYKLMKELNSGKQMKDVWTGSVINKSERKEGHHPTQKPEYLLERIILASTNVGDIILDPFCGSGTTGVVAKKLGRYFIGIDNHAEYLEITKRRIKKE